MSYYAKLDSNNVVIKVMVSDSDYMNNKFVDDSPGFWIETSDTGAGIGAGDNVGNTVEGKPMSGIFDDNNVSISNSIGLATFIKNPNKIRFKS